MTRLDVCSAIQVRNRARHLQDAVVRPGYPPRHPPGGFNFQPSIVDLLGFLHSDAIQRQDVRQCHNALELMYVGAAYDR